MSLRRPTLLAVALLLGAALLLVAALSGGATRPVGDVAAQRACGEAPVVADLDKREAPERGRSVGRDARGECEDLDAELQEPADAMLNRVAFGSKGVAAVDILPRARREAAASLRRTERAAPRVAGADWQFVGPTNIGGRLLDTALDPDDPATVYVASAGGGVFKSTDNGTTLVSIWPNDYPQAIGALVSTKSGVLYAGTGEAGPGGGSLTYGGDGVYRSKDKGKSWQRLPGLEKTSRIGRIVVDPANEKRIYVAALGNLFKPTDDRGLYLSEDGGDSFKRILDGDNDTTGVADLAIDPKDPKRLLATTWDHQRFPNEKRYNGPGSGVYRSTDGGATWARMGNGQLGPNPLLGRMGVAIDPKTPNNVYVIAAGVVGNNAGFYKSTDFGTTFVPVVDVAQAGLSGSSTYGWWFGRVWVDPNNSQNVYVAGVSLLKSEDGGLSFAGAGPGVHADQHGMTWDPRVKGRIWLANDGGLYRSDDDGATYKMAKVQPFSQPDAIDVSEQDPKRIVVGLQDNGEVRNYGQKDWNAFGPGGDGQRVSINPKDKNIVYACGQNGACQVSDDGGDSGTSIENNVTSARKLFFMPIEFDPADPTRTFTGGEFVNRCPDNSSGPCDVISPPLTNEPGRETNPLYATGQGGMSAIGVAPGGQKLYAGTDDGHLWVAASESEITPNDWTEVSDPDLPKAYVTRIEVDQKNPRRAYVTYSGYRAGDNAAYVLRTTDGGVTWDNITGNLPKAPVNDLNIVDDKLVVASDFGIYASKDTGGTWYRVGRDLPLVPTYEMRTHRPSNTLFVATFGRSVWKVGLDALDGIPAQAPAPGAAPAKGKARLSLPKVRSCRAGAQFRFRVRAVGVKGIKLRSAAVFVGKKKVKSLKGKAFSKRVVLKLPRGKVRVKVTAITSTGGRLAIARTYKACPRGR